MATPVLNKVQTQAIGYAPILKYFFESMGIEKIIDEHVNLDPRRKTLTHGQAAVAMVTAILFQVFQLYRICRFADKSRVLKVIFPGIEGSEYFDDRLADTLDAIYKFGIGNLEMLITKYIIEKFSIENDICHNDPTTASVYGDCDNHKTGRGINITYGFSKKHRADLKQFLWSLSVSNDSGFPLFQQAYDGNTSDVKTYVEQWQNLIDLLGRQDFLYVADCKLLSVENMFHIHENNGFFLAPAPMYASYQDVFDKALASHDREELIPYKNRVNRGFEVPVIIEGNGGKHTFRMIIIHDSGLRALKQKTLERHADNTRDQFEKLSKKINSYNLKTLDSIKKTCDSILSKNQTGKFFSFEILNNPVTTYKNSKRGRVSKEGCEKIEIIQDNFSVKLAFNKKRFDEALANCGYYPLITNKPASELSIADAMLAHKGQYKNEHTNRRAKSSLDLEPVYLHTPERIEAMLFLFKMALQAAVLIERDARKNIQARDKGLADFMPNKKDVRNPTAENLLIEFQDVVKGELPLPTGQIYGFVSELTDVQKDILSVMGIPEHYFSYEFLFNSA